MEKKLLLLYNVKAGRGRIHRKMDALEQIFSEAGYMPIPKMLRFGQNPFEGVNEQIDLVVICGGDGTINYVVNAMRAMNLDYPLGIIPAGTANDFAGAIGASSRTLKAARQIVNGVEQRIDCGRVNGMYFVNIFSFGMFTTTSQHTPEKIKRHIGKAAYLIEGSKELHNREFIPLHVVHDNGEFEVDSMITLVFNGETAGKFPLARNASIRDGLLDCMIMRKCGTFEGAWAAAKLIVLGRENEDIIHIRSSKLQITSPLSPLTDMDGQPSAEFPLEIECLPGNLRIIVPKEG
ncbi:MAG: YegS/Rv2252/BmrU family lipid kinase [Rikenellaceae bacterium]|nr:YegS/Rv2252/BmrU family lipid kinase [Rikenellaceae bacterium]